MKGVVIVAALLALSSSVSFPGNRAFAAGVVGTGTPASCTEAALDAALSEGGTVTFDCGPDPVSITITRGKSIRLDTAVDGGNLITLIGGPLVDSEIYIYVSEGVTLDLHGMTFSFNIPFYFGYSIYIYFDGTLNVTSCTFRHNNEDRHRFPHSEIIHNNGNLNVTNSIFSENHGPLPIRSEGALTVTNSTFVRNRGGLWNGWGGTAMVSGSTFRHNKSPVIENVAYTLGRGVQVVNSTFAGNRGGSTIAQGDYEYGGRGGPLTVTNCTFSHNRGSRLTGCDAGGICVYYGSRPATLRNTIMANNGGGNCGGPGPITDGGHNLQWPPADTSCPGDFSDPKLARILRDNGGATRTFALRPGSAAINAGDNGVCAAPIGAPDFGAGGVDQRGFARPGTGAANCSIGAYEFNSQDPPPTTDTPTP